MARHAIPQCQQTVVRICPTIVTRVHVSMPRVHSSDVEVRILVVVISITASSHLLPWKDSLKDTLKQSNISTTHWQDVATDRSAWRRSIHDGLVLYDDSRREGNASNRARRHAAHNATSSASQDAYMCRHCGRTCSSRIGILNHERACNATHKEDVTHDSHRRIDGQHYY